MRIPTPVAANSDDALESHSLNQEEEEDDSSDHSSVPPEDSSVGVA